MRITRVGVIGAGAMGTGIAALTASAGIPVVLLDVPGETERDAVAKRLSEMTGKEVQVHPRVDEQILGGLVARIGDRLIDGSTRTKLIALKRQLAGRTR